MAGMALISSELSSCCNYVHIFAIPYKNGTLARSYINKASFWVIDVEISGDIKDEEETVLASINVELLFLDWIDFLDFEGIFLIDKSIIIWIEFFLCAFFGFKNVRIFHNWFFFFFNFIFVLNKSHLALYLFRRRNRINDFLDRSYFFFIHDFVLILDKLLFFFCFTFLRKLRQCLVWLCNWNLNFDFISVSNVFIHLKGILMNIVGFWFFLPFRTQPITYPHYNWKFKYFSSNKPEKSYYEIFL